MAGKYNERRWEYGKEWQKVGTSALADDVARTRALEMIAHTRSRVFAFFFASIIVMPALRVRVESTPPLSPLKAWFPLNEDQYETITDLQAEICSRLNVKYYDVVLVLDGYELFTGSTIRDVVRDGELIMYVHMLSRE